jgi:hypothetical protein
VTSDLGLNAAHSRQSPSRQRRRVHGSTPSKASSQNSPRGDYGGFAQKTDDDSGSNAVMTNDQGKDKPVEESIK